MPQWHMAPLKSPWIQQVRGVVVGGVIMVQCTLGGSGRGEISVW